ncbi:hypothetical protein [uncultured Roseivirga sp.]|uniref:hypothetical protein n=1 Tax=uncultured Roseivirga sp. TaxID=543088 RepID=UPI0030DC0F34|tara:strand:+ start:2628 stop:2975 length:348 start_codon:yes stop_codon:yes gene_type:complete
MPAKDFSLALKAKIKLEVHVYQALGSSDILESLVAHLLKIGLTFRPDNPEGSSNVCFAESEELRPEFRSSYTSTDLIHYIYADLANAEQTDLMNITYPKNTAQFWALVAQGQTEN